jgi:hypothetical protein
MSRTPTISGAHCSEHETHRGMCAACQRASIEAAREQLALVTPRAIGLTAASPSKPPRTYLPLAA